MKPFENPRPPSNHLSLFDSLYSSLLFFFPLFTSYFPLFFLTREHLSRPQYLLNARRRGGGAEQSWSNDISRQEVSELISHQSFLANSLRYRDELQPQIRALWHYLIGLKFTTGGTGDISKYGMTKTFAKHSNIDCKDDPESFNRHTGVVFR